MNITKKEKHALWMAYSFAYDEYKLAKRSRKRFYNENMKSEAIKMYKDILLTLQNINKKLGINFEYTNLDK